MFLGFNILYLDVTISNKTMEVMMLDRNVLGMRSHLWSNCEFNRPSIVLMNCDYFFGNTSQHLRSVTLKFE